jgi:preprotein translocase subunit Sec63
MVKWTFETYEIVEADFKFARDWNPYSILGLKDDHSFATEMIKKAYDKFDKRMKANVAKEGKSAELDLKGKHGKLAHKTLTDPQIFKNWQDFGNPDGSAFRKALWLLPSSLWMLSDLPKKILIPLVIALLADLISIFRT